MKFIFFFITFFMSLEAMGYANFIGHGYPSCLNCHFNPMGGGQLNDYGRAVSATAISGRLIYPESFNEEKIAYMSGFLFKKPSQNWLRTQVNYRGFNLIRNPGSSENEIKTWIPMQRDLRVTLKFGENDKLIFSGDYGKTPYPLNGIEGEDYDEYRSRSHYVGYRFTPSFGLYAGLMDKAYGIRVIEHSAYSRLLPQVTQNDQTHGILGHYLNENWEIGAHIFGGNLAQDQELRMKGFSSIVEKTFLNIHRIGFSFQQSKNDFLELLSYSTHARLNVKEGSALLAELGETKKKTKNSIEERTSRYGLLQGFVRPWRGFYVLTNVEYLKNDTTFDSYNVRWGPGIQYFPMQRLELRADIYNTRNFSPGSSTLDSWLLLYQLHLWF